MIHRLHLVNWKSHAKTEIRFSKGTNVIVGINGAGKSSILEAILFALYGELPGGATYEKVLRRGTTRDARGVVELEMDVGGKHIVITREFSRKGQTRARIRGDVKTLTEKPSQVTEEVIKLLGMDRKTFEKAVYGRQGEIAALLNDRSERKRLINRILGIEKLQVLQTAINSAITRLRRIAGSADLGTMERDLENARQRLKEVSAELEGTQRLLAEWKSRERELDTAIARTREELQELEKSLAEARSARQELARLKGMEKNLEERALELRREGITPKRPEDVEKLRGKLKELERRAKQIDELLTLEKRLLELANKRVEKPDAESARKSVEELEGQLQRVREELAEKRRALQETEKRIRELEAEAAELDRRIRTLTGVEQRIKELEKRVEELGSVEEIEKALRELSEEISAAETEIKQESTFVSALRSASQCPVCGSALDDERRRELLEEHTKRMAKLRERVEELRRKVAELKRRQAESKGIQEELRRLSAKIGILEELRRRREEIRAKLSEGAAMREKLRRTIAELEARARELSEQLREKRAALEQLEKQLREYEEVEKARRELASIEERLRILGERPDLEDIRRQITLAEKGVELSRIEERLAQIRQKIEELESRAQNVEELENKVQTTRDALSKLVAERRALEAKILTEERRVKNLEELKATLERRIEELERRIAEITDAAERKAILENVAKIVSAAAEQVKESRLAAINTILNTVWATLYPRKDITELRIVPEKNDYRIYAKTANGETVDVDSLSGGERFDVALALRIAVAAAWGRSMGLLVLDEPTHNLDEEATDALAEVLRHLPGDSFEQIIIITHNEALKKAATGKIIVVERDKERGRPSIVREVPVTAE